MSTLYKLAQAEKLLGRIYRYLEAGTHPDIWAIKIKAEIAEFLELEGKA